MRKENKVPRTDCWREDPDDLIIVGLNGEGPAWLNQPDRNALPIDEDIVESIGLVGVTEVLTVMRIGPQKFVESGRQRTKACVEYNRRLKAALEGDDFEPDPRTANLIRAGVPLEYDTLKERVKCLYVRGKAADIIANDIVSNSHRKDVSAVQRARNFDAYIEACGLERSQAITRCSTLAGISTNAVRQDLELLNLAPELQEAVDDGAVSADTARSAKNSDYIEQKTVAEKAVEKKKETGKKFTRNEASKNLSNPAPARRGKKKLKALLDANKDILSDDFRHGVLWALGETIDADYGIRPAPAKKK